MPLLLHLWPSIHIILNAVINVRNEHLDKSGANKAAIDAIYAGRDVPIVVCQFKYLNNIAAQDRAIKRVTRLMLNFKPFRSADSVFAVLRKCCCFIDNATKPAVPLLSRSALGAQILRKFVTQAFDILSICEGDCLAQLSSR